MAVAEDNSLSKRQSHIMFVTHINIVLYSLCFWIQMGTIPFLLKKFDASPVIFGYFQSFFAVLQLLGGPLYGRFGDLYGSRLSFIIAFIASGLSYFISALANSITILFLSRLPTFFMHAMQGGQMIITDVAPSEKRAEALGKLGVAYAIGMVVGNLLGGVITHQFGERAAALLATFGSFISIVLVYFYIPPIDRKKSEDAGLLNVSTFRRMFSQSATRLLLIVKTVTGIPIGVLQSMFPIIMVNMYHLNAQSNGFVMAYIGLLSMIVQGVGLAFLCRWFSDNCLLKWSCFLLIWGYLGQSQAENLTIFLVAVLPICVGLTIKNVVISSSLTRTVVEQDTGSILGVNMAVNSVIRIISPAIGGWLLDSFGYSSFGWLGALISSLVTAYLFKYLP